MSTDTDDRFGERLATVEEGVDQMGDRLATIERRLDTHDGRFDALDQKIDDRFDQLDRKIDRTETKLLRYIGVMIGVATVVLAIIQIWATGVVF